MKFLKKYELKNSIIPFKIINNEINCKYENAWSADIIKLYNKIKEDLSKDVDTFNKYAELAKKQEEQEEKQKAEERQREIEENRRKEQEDQQLHLAAEKEYQRIKEIVDNRCMEYLILQKSRIIAESSPCLVIADTCLEGQNQRLQHGIKVHRKDKNGRRQQEEPACKSLLLIDC